MTLQPQHQQELFDIASAMATELQCYAHATEGDGPGLRQTNALLNRYQRLQNKIQNSLSTLVVQAQTTKS